MKNIKVASGSLTLPKFKIVMSIILISLLLMGLGLVPQALAEEQTCQGSCCESSGAQCCSQGAMGCCQSAESTAQNVTSTTGVLWTYEDFTSEFNRTAYFNSSVVEAENVSMQFYRLTYFVQHSDYVLTLSTMLSPLSSETYNSSFTVMNYAPTEEYGITSIDVVVFNESVTLSQHYVVLGEATKEFGKRYEKSGNETLMQFANAYYTMKEEAKILSKLVEKQLPQYNREILQSSAVLVDFEPCEICPCPIINSDGTTIYPTCGGGSPPPPPPGCTTDWTCVGACIGIECACAYYGVNCPGLPICDFCLPLCQLCVTFFDPVTCAACGVCLGFLFIACTLECCN